MYTHLTKFVRLTQIRYHIDMVEYEREPGPVSKEQVVEALALLRRGLGQNNYLDTHPALRLLARSKDAVAQEAVRSCLSSEYYAIRLAAIDSLIKGGAATVEDLTNALGDDNPVIRIRVMKALTK